MSILNLRILNIDITGKCNCSCIHCGQEFKSSELGREEIKEIVKEAKLLGLTDVVISGGEPFYHPDILGILEDLYRERVYVSILSNGMLLDNKVVSYLSSFPNLTNIRISIESINPDKLDKIRNAEGCFSKITKSLSLLRKYRIPYGTSMTVGAHNIEEISDFVEFSILEKASFMRASPLIRKIYMSQNHNGNVPYYVSEVSSADIAFMLLTSVADNSEHFHTGFLPVPESKRTFSNNFRLPCPAGRFLMTVTSDKHVTFCPFSFPEVAISLESQSLSNAWKTLVEERNNAIYMEKIERMDSSGNSKRFCLIKNQANPEDFNPLQISEDLYEKVTENNGYRLRKTLSGIVFRQKELNSLNIQPCWRSSPLFLIPLRY